MPSGGGQYDLVSELAVRRAEICELISLKLKECLIQRGMVERFINQQEDSEIRIILRLRHIDGLSWERIAIESAPMNEDGEVTHEQHRTTIKRKYDKFIERMEG